MGNFFNKARRQLQPKPSQNKDSDLPKRYNELVDCARELQICNHKMVHSFPRCYKTPESVGYEILRYTNLIAQMSFTIANYNPLVSRIAVLRKMKVGIDCLGQCINLAVILGALKRSSVSIAAKTLAILDDKARGLICAEEAKLEKKAKEKSDADKSGEGETKKS